MYVDYDKLRKSGYSVDADRKGATIYPDHPLVLDWEAMAE